MRALHAVGLFAMAVALPSHAKVSNSLLLCLPSKGAWLSPTTHEKLQGFAASVVATTRTYGAPEVALSRSVELDRMGTGRRARQDLELALVHHLRSMEVGLGQHELYRLPEAASPMDFGCDANDVAVDIEVLFKHPLY